MDEQEQLFIKEMQSINDPEELVNRIIKYMDITGEYIGTDVAMELVKMLLSKGLLLKAAIQSLNTDQISAAETLYPDVYFNWMSENSEFKDAMRGYIERALKRSEQALYDVDTELEGASKDFNRRIDIEESILAAERTAEKRDNGGYYGAPGSESANHERQLQLFYGEQNWIFSKNQDEVSQAMCEYFEFGGDLNERIIDIGKRWSLDAEGEKRFIEERVKQVQERLEKGNCKAEEYYDLRIALSIMAMEERNRTHTKNEVAEAVKEVGKAEVQNTLEVLTRPGYEQEAKRQEEPQD